MIRIVCWNIARRHAAWRGLLDMSADIALLQEAGPPPADVAARIRVDQFPFANAAGRPLSRTAVVGLSDRVQVQWLEPVPIAVAQAGDLVVSHPGSIAAAIVTPPSGEPLTVASICAEYDKPHRSTGRMSWDITDASVHRIISDLSLLVGRQYGHRIIAAGDLSVLYGYGENQYWKRRYATVFDRLAAIGLPLVGPQAPHGLQAEPRPDELPAGSLNVPTYVHTSQTPMTATRQLDFVFASEIIGGSIQVKALNGPQEWGPSDHCRIEIVLQC